MGALPVSIPGVVGKTAVEFVPWKGPRLTLDGRPITPHGLLRNRVTLPGTDGPIEARVRTRVFNPYPLVTVGGVDIPTGPPQRRALLALTFTPLLALVLVQGALGAVVAILGIQLNHTVARSGRPVRAQVGLMLAVLVGVIAVDLLVIAALN